MSGELAGLALFAALAGATMVVVRRDMAALGRAVAAELERLARGAR